MKPNSLAALSAAGKESGGDAGCGGRLVGWDGGRVLMAGRQAWQHAAPAWLLPAAGRLPHHCTSQQVPKVAQPARGRAQGGVMARLLQHCARGQADLMPTSGLGKAAAGTAAQPTTRWATGLTLTHQKEYQITGTVQFENTGVCR